MSHFYFPSEFCITTLQKSLFSFQAYGFIILSYIQATESISIPSFFIISDYIRQMLKVVWL